MALNYTVTELHPRVVRINRRIERLTQMRVNQQFSSLSTQVTNYGIGMDSVLERVYMHM